MTDRGLKTAYSRLNPRFELQTINEALSKQLNADYMSLKVPSDKRNSRIQRIAVQNRMLKLKEDVGVLAYLRRNGLENESNKYNSSRTIIEF
jgi:hypothetical protein